MGKETQCDQRDAFEALDLGGLDSKLSLIPCMTFYTSKSLYGAQGSWYQWKKRPTKMIIKSIQYCDSVLLIHTFFSVSLWPQLHCSLGRESAIVSRVRAINLPPKVIVVELKNLPVSLCYIDNKESLELGLWLSGIMVQGGGMVEWFMSLGLQIHASPTWPWATSAQCMGLVYPTV